MIVEIDNKTCEIADWFIEKNGLSSDFLGSELLTTRETDKAVLLTNMEGVEGWLPKSVIREVE